MATACRAGPKGPAWADLKVGPYVRLSSRLAVS